MGVPLSLGMAHGRRASYASQQLTFEHRTVGHPTGYYRPVCFCQVVALEGYGCHAVVFCKTIYADASNIFV
jgi:hypothetical protein